MYDLRDPALNNYTTPRDMVRFYRQLLDGAGMAPQFQAEMLRSLHGQMARNKLPSGLPREVALAHKTGDMTAIEHDAGIFFGSRRRVIAVVMSKDLARNVEGVALCRRVGEAGWAWAQGAPMPAAE
jgi:beta-lactamase class A